MFIDANKGRVGGLSICTALAPWLLIDLIYVLRHGGPRRSAAIQNSCEGQVRIIVWKNIRRLCHYYKNENKTNKQTNSKASWKGQRSLKAHYWEICPMTGSLLIIHEDEWITSSKCEYSGSLDDSNTPSLTALAIIQKEAIRKTEKCFGTSSSKTSNALYNKNRETGPRLHCKVRNHPEAYNLGPESRLSFYSIWEICTFYYKLHISLIRTRQDTDYNSLKCQPIAKTILKRAFLLGTVVTGKPSLHFYTYCLPRFTLTFIFKSVFKINTI